MVLHPHRHRRLDSLLLLSLLQFLLDRPLVSMQPIELLKTYDSLQIRSVFLELSLDVCLEIGVDIVWTFTNQSGVENQQHCLFSLTDESKLREIFPLPLCIFYWIQGKII